MFSDFLEKNLMFFLNTNFLKRVTILGDILAQSKDLHFQDILKPSQ